MKPDDNLVTSDPNTSASSLRTPDRKSARILTVSQSSVAFGRRSISTLFAGHCNGFG